MALTEEALLHQARRSYELARLRGTIRDSWIVAPIVAVGTLLHPSWLQPVALGAALFALTTAVSWRGQAWGRALWPGFLAGAVPLLVPGLAPAGAFCRLGGSCWSVCMLLCPLSGIAAGLVVGVLAARQEQDRAQFLAAGVLVAAVTGCLGCGLAGIAGIAGMAAGGVLGLVPVYVGLQLRRA